MKCYALVILGVLALFGRIDAKPEEETTATSQLDKKVDEAKDKKDDESKTNEDSNTTSTESVVEGKSGEKRKELDPADPKVKRATDESPAQERTGESSEVSTAIASVDEGKSGESGSHDEKEAIPTESTELPKEEERAASEEKSASKADENKSDDHVNERSGVAERTEAAESRENKDSPKEELRSTAEVSTSTEVRQRSAYGSSSILETKGRSGDSDDSDSTDFKGRAHVNLRMPPVNPLGVINNINDIGSRRMDQPNMMLNIAQHFPPPIHQVLPKPPPSPFKSYLNAAPSMPSIGNLPNLAQDIRSYNEYRPETNAYPYTPTSSQQADPLPKFPTLRDLPKLPSYPNNFYKPYDQNYSGNFGARPRRYTVPSMPDSMNKYAFNNFGYPQYIR